MRAPGLIRVTEPVNRDRSFFPRDNGMVVGITAERGAHFDPADLLINDGLRWPVHFILSRSVSF